MSQVGMRFTEAPSSSAAGKRNNSSGGRSTLTVSQVIELANRSLERGVGGQWIEGEVSGLHLAQSGHAYFTLKDAKAALSTAIWRSSMRRLKFQLKNGQRLLVFGKVAVYPAQGRFQLYAERAEPVGEGALMLQFEQLKAKLAAEGLFAKERKREVPRWPRCIGVVTSPGGAAIHDILTVLEGRCPSRVLLAPARVQGEGAAEEIATALRRLWREPEVDVIIVGRGGGSVEDLWAFNEEVLARCIVESPVPVVSAVGHEVDVSISDMVADLRAATPSHAAELVVPDLAEVRLRLQRLAELLRSRTERRLIDRRGHLDTLQSRLERVGRRLLAVERRRQAELVRRLEGAARQLPLARRRRLAELQRRLNRCDPRGAIARQRGRLQLMNSRLSAAMTHHLNVARTRHAKAVAGLSAMSPLAVLERGYAVATHETHGVLRDSASLAVGDLVEVRLARGSFSATLVSKTSSKS